MSEGSGAGAGGRLRLECFIPAYNEAADLEEHVHRLVLFCRENLSGSFRVTVVDNGSTDRTPAVLAALAASHPEVGSIRYPEKGRGRALRTAWLNSGADVLCYMDVDLSTNLRALPPLLAALIHSDYDLGTGSRLVHGAIVTRQWRRELISRCYNFLIRLMFWHKFRDAQCGFKAITRKAARELIPQVKDNEWFFDSELLLKAERQGYRIFEVPVEWVEDLGSTVNIAKTAWQDIKGLVRVRLGG